MEDIEIARNTKLEDINVIARKLNVEDDIEQYGKHKAKISLEVMKKLKSKKVRVLTRALSFFYAIFQQRR